MRPIKTHNRRDGGLKSDAIDGCKLPSNASKEWPGTIAELKKKRGKLEKYISRIISRRQELDEGEKAGKIQRPYKKTAGDGNERRGRSMERLEKKLKKLNVFLEKAGPGIGASGEEAQPNITDNESARIKGPHGYIQGYNGIAAADSGSRVIVSAGAIGSGPESGCFPGMLDRLEENMKTITDKEEPLKKALLEGDTGYFSEENLQKAAERKIKVLIPGPQFRQRDPCFAGKKKEKVGKKRHAAEGFNYDKDRDGYSCPAGKALEYKCNAGLRNDSGKKYQAKSGTCAACPLPEKCVNGRSGKNPVRTLYIADKKYQDNLSEKMRKKTGNPACRELYSRRMQMIEPVYSGITYCKGMNRFTLRTRKKAGIQWKLYCIAHNIGKCIKPLGKKHG